MLKFSPSIKLGELKSTSPLLVVKTRRRRRRKRHKVDKSQVCYKCKQPLTTPTSVYSPKDGVFHVIHKKCLPVKAARQSQTAIKRKKELLKIDPNCYFCGDKLAIRTAILDHKKSKINRLGNCIIICKDCEKQKGDKDFTTFTNEVFDR